MRLTMIVKCVKIISRATGKDLGDKSPWLIKDKSYIVFAIRYRWDTKTIDFLLESENFSDPTFFDSNQFEIISNRLSSYWVFGKDEDNFICFMPQAWFQTGFGEGIDNGDESVMSIFRHYRDLIIKEDPLNGSIQVASNKNN